MSDILYRFNRRHQKIAGMGFSLTSFYQVPGKRGRNFSTGRIVGLSKLIAR